MRLKSQTRRELWDLLDTAQSQGWREVCFDVRTELQRREAVAAGVADP